MKITVNGYAKKQISPDEVIVNLYFTRRAETYEEAVNKGFNDIYTFNTLVLLENGLKDEDLKSLGFSVSEEKIYNEETKKNEVVGYVFSENAKLTLDYDNELLTNILKAITTNNISVEFNLNFGIKDESSCEKELINKAYLDALDKANVIANAARSKVEGCLSIEAQELGRSFLSNTAFDKSLLKINNSAFDTNIIHPEDITVEKVLTAIFEAE